MYLIVKNSCMEVHEYKWGSCYEIEKLFRKFDPLTHKYNYVGIHYDAKNEILYLPRGMDIWYAENKLGVRAIIDHDYNKYRETDIKLFKPPRNDTQKEAMRFMLGRSEYSHTASKTQLGLYLNTGKGKTYIATATFALMKIVPIIIAARNDWLKQWADRIMEYTNIKKNEICFLTSQWMRTVVLKGEYPRTCNHKIFLSTHRAIGSFAATYGWEDVNKFFKIAGIGIKIFDECHTDFDNLCLIDFYTNVWKTYYLSASPTRTDESEKKVYEGYYMRNIPSIDLFDPEEDPHANYLALHYSTKPSPVMVTACKNYYGLDRHKYTELTINDGRFKKMAVIALNMAIKEMNKYGPEAQCMIYIGVNKAIKDFMEYIPELVPEMEGNMGIFTSIATPEEKEIARTKRFILTTTVSAGACVDIAHLRVVIVMCEPFAAAITAQQSIGRLRQEDTLYIDLVDTGFKQIQRFYAKKLPIFKKYAKTVTKKVVPDDKFDLLYEKAYANLNPKEEPILNTGWFDFAPRISTYAVTPTTACFDFMYVPSTEVFEFY